MTKVRLMLWDTAGQYHNHNINITKYQRLNIITIATKVRLMLWDTAGQEEFDALTKAYYRGAQARNHR